MLDKKLTGSNDKDKATIDQSPLHSRLNNNSPEQPQQPDIKEQSVGEQKSDGSGDAFSATEEVRE